jgi:hypothetical protein
MINVNFASEVLPQDEVTSQKFRGGMLETVMHVHSKTTRKAFNDALCELTTLPEPHLFAISMISGVTKFDLKNRVRGGIRTVQADIATNSNRRREL